MIPVCVPDLTSDGRPCTLVQWLADFGSHVDQGDWIAELLIDGVLFSLESPATGRVVKLDALPGALVSTSQQIAWIERDDELPSD
jgi:pyruvate/2-oxoglutarate dehydrogenase complex dihydrolipoamide acyltransferase (E2) component